MQFTIEEYFYFWNFPFYIFGPLLTVGNCNHGKWNRGHRGATVLPWNEWDFYQLWEREGRSTRKRLAFGERQGVWAEGWSGDFLFGISSGREGGKIFKKPVLQGLDCWAKMFGYYPEMQRSVGRFQSCKVRGEGDCGQGKRLLKSLGREHSQPKKTRVRVRYSLSQQNWVLCFRQ